ncbi:MAG: heparinase II/III family protein [Desulfomonile sp.]|nr:heparinase II/III family protein [Desulfomonile sp.]
MRLNRISYYLKRVATARPSEPFVRLSRQLRHRKEERAFARDPESYSVERLWERREEWLTPTGEDPIHTSVNKALAAQLPAGWWQDPGFWKAFASLYPRETDTIIERADSVAAGRIVLFGWTQMEFGRPIPWSNRFSGKEPGLEWPRAHYARLDFLHDPSDPERDVKWCWELNRFQYLLLLGAAWRLTGDERYPRAAREQIDSWIAAVRYPQGVQWSSNLEVALRLLSWMRCHILCMDSAAWDEEFMRRFISCLSLHCAHVESELTVHHALSNHLLGEAASIATAGILYPCFTGAFRRVRRGIQILKQVAPLLILPDGVYAEQTTGYFRFVAEFLLPLLYFAKSSGTAIPQAVSESVAAGLRFVDAVSADLREVPAIGDADSGHAIGWGLGNYWDFSGLVAAGTVLCGARINPGQIPAFPAEAFLMLGPSGREAFQALGASRIAEPKRGAISVMLFPHGGYQVSSDVIFHVVFDTGPLGMAPRYPHGHADALAIILSFNSVPVIVDPGTFVYNGLVQWREYFRSTAAHNTISLDGLSQSQPLETFLWERDLNVSGGPPRYGDGWVMLHGFVKWREAIHYRYVLHFAEQGVLVFDRLEGKGSRMLTWSTQWHPACRVSPGPGPRFHAATDAGELELLLLGPEPAKTKILRGRCDPPAGWYSASYGFKQPCCTLRQEVTRRLPATFLCAIKPKGLVLELSGGLDQAGLPSELVERLHSTEFASWAGA